MAKEARNIQRFLRYENTGYYLRGYNPKHQINYYIYEAEKHTFFKINFDVGTRKNGQTPLKNALD